MSQHGIEAKKIGYSVAFALVLMTFIWLLMSDLRSDEEETPLPTIQVVERSLGDQMLAAPEPSLINGTQEIEIDPAKMEERPRISAADAQQQREMARMIESEGY